MTARLEGLYGHQVLRSHERVESHALIARELSDYLLRWSDRAPVDTTVFKLASPNLALYSMVYGDEVRILPQAYDGFLLVHYARAGAIEVEADGRLDRLQPGEVLVSNPRRSVSLRWSAGCEQVILRVPHALVARSMAAGSGGARGAVAPPALLQTPALKLGAREAKLWCTQLDAFAAYAHAAGGDPLYRPWLEQVEHSMAQFLGLQFGLRPSPGPALPEAGSAAGASARDARRQERLLAYADAHLHQPLALADLARAVSLSPRQFTQWMQQQHGLSPMAWLRQRRLEHVREGLRSCPQADVTSVALAHGFTHLGRFSQYYSRAFGEQPSQTRRRAAAEAG